ncbi:hypothetical protein AAC387_Pa07g1578 [Persea americana]
MKQKIVMKVQMNCQKCRTKAMEIAACTHGVISVALEGDNQEKVVVTGDGIDPVNLARDMRKKVGHTSILSVEEVKAKEEKKQEKTEPKIEYYHPCPQPIMYAYENVYDNDPSCSIM